MKKKVLFSERVKFVKVPGTNLETLVQNKRTRKQFFKVEDGREIHGTF